LNQTRTNIDPKETRDESSLSRAATIDKKESKTVSTVVKLLSLFSIDKDEIGVREASQLLSLSPAKVHRLMYSLESYDILEKKASKKYRLGLKIFELGSLYPLHSSLRKLVRPHAEDLSARLNCGVNFAILSKSRPLSAIIIDRIVNLQSPSLIQRVAFNIPLHSSALGKALLAFSESDAQKMMLDEIILKKFTEATITAKSQLISELKKIQKQGYSVDWGGLHPNVICVAAPIMKNNCLVGALSVTEFTDRPSEKQIKDIGNILKERTIFISRQL
jgi:IclR family transcriptional regulator, KDG regulon repressor